MNQEIDFLKNIRNDYDLVTAMQFLFAMPSLISNTKLIHHLNHPIQQNEVCTNFMLIMHVELWLHITLSSPSLLEKLINQYLITCTKFALVFYMQKNRRNDANYSGY